MYKLIVVIVFIIIGIVLNCGGGDGEYSTYVGGRYWRDPGAFANGFKGVCSVFVTAAFSFAGTELGGWLFLSGSRTLHRCFAHPREFGLLACHLYVQLVSLPPRPRIRARLSQPLSSTYCSPVTDVSGPLR